MPSIHVILALSGYFIFNAGVGAMALPTESQKTGFYGWIYRFFQRLAANADRVVEARIQGVGNAASTAVSVATSHDQDSVVVTGDDSASK